MVWLKLVTGGREDVGGNRDGGIVLDAGLTFDETVRERIIGISIASCSKQSTSLNICSDSVRVAPLLRSAY